MANKRKLSPTRVADTYPSVIQQSTSQPSTSRSPPKVNLSFLNELSCEFTNYAMVKTSDDDDWSPPSSPLPTLEEMRQMNREKDKYLEQYNHFECNDANKYIPLIKIGQGTFGEVFKAQEKRHPKNIVAMKKLIMLNQKEGFPTTSLREIRILQALRHENIVRLIEICQTKVCKANNHRSTFFLVFEFCEHDLAGLLSNLNVKFELGDLKQLFYQILKGLFYIHANKILHRDLKTSNILITKNGILKLADFGLARAFSSHKDKPNKFTNCVVTLWYRAPELLLGEIDYGPAVDIWAAGCIMAELWTRFPIMRGTSEHSQLVLICKLCGSITPEVWPDVVKYNLYKKIMLPNNYTRCVYKSLKPYIRDSLGFDLLNHLLVLDPKKRYDADTALNHNFFWTDPMPSDLSKVMSQIKTCNYEYLTQHHYLHHKQSTAKRPAPTAKQPAPTAKQPAPTAKQLAPTAKQLAPTAKQLAPTAKQLAPTAKQPAPTTKWPASTVINNRLSTSGFHDRIF